MTNLDGALVQPSESPQRLVDMVFRLREYGIIVVLIVFIAVTTGIQPRFLGQQNIKFVLLNATIFALLALGETMVVVSRQMDLSVGSVLGLSAYVSSNLFGQVHGIPIPVVFLAGLGIGLVCGVVNGAITAFARVPGLVVTLATLYIIRGIDISIIGGGEVVASSLPAHFSAIGSDSVVGIPYVTMCVAVVIAAGTYFLRSFRSGTRALRHRVESGRSAPRRNPDSTARLQCLCGQRRHRRTRGGHLGVFLRDSRLDRGHRLRADGRHSGRRWRRRDLRRQRERGRRCVRRPPAFHHRHRSLRPRRIAVLGPGL